MTPDSATLIGYVQAVAEQPGFLLLVFRMGASNRYVTQVVGRDDRVTAFRLIDPPLIQYGLQVEAEIQIGDRALWGYVVPGQPPRIDRRKELTAWLAGQVSEIANPLLRLQAADFCALEGDMQAAWRASFDHLAHVAPRSAAAWRDIVILPSRVRQAVRRAIDIHDLEATARDLGRDVDVQVEDGQLLVTFERELFDRLQANPSALADISRDTTDVRDAFSLGSELVTLARDPARESEDFGVEVEPVVISIGTRALQVVEKALPPARRPRDRIPGGAAAFISEGPVPVLVLQSHRILFRGDAGLASLDAHLPADTEVSRMPLLFVFGASANEVGIAHEASRLARRADQRRYRPIAVIPHLPDPALSRDFDTYRQLLSSLADGFEAICILSDQSPHLRPGLPYGPSRSRDAPAARLARLISQLGAGALELTGPVRRADRYSVRVHVFSSVSDSGGLSGPRLLDHAFRRATDFTLEWGEGTQAHATFSGPVPRSDEGKITEILRREHLSQLAVATGRGSRTGPRNAKLHLTGVNWSARPLDLFEHFCRAELDKHGWILGESTHDDADFEIERRGVHALVQCKAFRADEGDRPLRVRLKRRSREELVLLTDATIHRGDYIQQLLAGCLPVHVSRISALHYIYTQRYTYLLRALRGKTAIYRRRIIDAAFHNIFKALAAGLIPGDAMASVFPNGEETDVDLDACQVDLFADALRVHVALASVSKSGAPAPYSIGILLTQAGWEAVDL